MYFKYSLVSPLWALPNLAFYVSCAAVLVTGAAALSTTGINKRWDTFLAQEEDQRQENARRAKHPGD